MIRKYHRPRRRVDLHALALDAPLPLLVTCAGLGLSWPSGRLQDAPEAPDEARSADPLPACAGYGLACPAKH